MDAYENLIERRSIKSYDGRAVDKSTLEKIVYAGQCAPSGMNQQSYAFVVVQNEKTIKALSKLNAEIMHVDMDPFYGAKTLIVVFADTNVPTYIYDGSLAMANLMNAANALGVDSCWIHRAKEVFETEAGKQWMQEWGIPQSYQGIGHCILGYRKDELAKRSKRCSKIVYA